MIGPEGQLLCRLIDASPEGYALVDAGSVRWVNSALAGFVGEADSSALVGRVWVDLFRDAGFGIPETHGVIECGLLRVGMEPFPVAIDAIPLEDGTGECGTPASQRLQAFRVSDLRALRTLEDEVLRSGRRLHAANRELAAARERNRREDAERDELLNVISHELRTPVTVITGYNRLLLEEEVGALNETQRRFLGESQKSCQRLDHFLGNLIEAATKGVASGPLEVSEGRVEGLFETVVAMLGPLLVDRRLRIETDCERALPSLRFDPRRIEQVLVNLANNAARFAPVDSAIVFEARAVTRGSRPGLEIAVRDSGPGVAAQDLTRIFDAYVQCEASRQSGGLGLGLAICRRIVEAHGGVIHADDVERGMRVAFWLPAHTPIHGESVEGAKPA